MTRRAATVARAPDLRAALRLLESQHAALAQGNLGLLAAPGLQALCDRIEQATGAPTAVETALGVRVRDAATRNLRGVSATLAGLRDAQALLDAARAAQGSVGYGPEGRQIRVEGGPVRLAIRR